MSHLIGLFAALAASFVFTHGCNRLGLPRVFGQLLAGMVLGVTLFAMPGDWGMDVLADLADVGILVLFFFVGLEIRPSAISKNVRESTLISIFNTLLPLAGGYLFSKYFIGLDDGTSLVLGATLSFSSQAIALDVLEEAGKLKTRIGGLIVAAGLIDDLLEIGILAVLFTFLRVASGPAIPGGIVTEVILFVISLGIIKYFLVPLIFRNPTDRRSSPVFMTGAIVLALLAAVIADEFEIGAVLGALFTGIIVREYLIHNVKRQWEEFRLSRMMQLIGFGFFVPLFFVYVGLNTHPDALSAWLPAVIGLTAIAFVGTIAGTMIAVKLSGGSWHEGHVVGWGVNSKGDTELVVAAIALKKGFLTPELFTLVVFMAIATTVISPLVFRKLLENYSAKPVQKRRKRK